MFWNVTLEVVARSCGVDSVRFLPPASVTITLLGVPTTDCTPVASMPTIPDWLVAANPTPTFI